MLRQLENKSMKLSKLEGEVRAKMESVNRIHVYIFLENSAPRMSIVCNANE